MTVAVIDHHTPFTLAAQWSGFRLDTVNGKRHYVSVDKDNRAVVGPVARRRKPMFARVVRDEKPDPVPQPLRMLGQSLGSLGFPTPPSPQKRSLWRRMKDSVLGRFYDQEWHKAMQHAALDLMCWTLALTLLGLAAKVMVWTWL